MADEDRRPEYQEGTAEFQERSAMLDEILGQTDRAAAIVAFAYLDDTLTEVIQSHLHNFKHKGENIRRTMFQGAGPLATFSARRRLAYLLGIFGPKTYADLGRLAQIRNEFAHTRSRRTFKSQRIKNLCEALTTRTRAKIPAKPPYTKARLEYTSAIIVLCGGLQAIADRSDPPPDKHYVLP